MMGVPVESRVIAAPMSQHVPMSLWARTAADIIIVYSGAPLECGRPSPWTDSVVTVFWGEGIVALARAIRVLCAI